MHINVYFYLFSLFISYSLLPFRKVEVMFIVLDFSFRFSDWMSLLSRTLCVISANTQKRSIFKTLCSSFMVKQMSLDAWMICKSVMSWRHSSCVSVNYLIVDVWLSARSATAWNIDKKHTVNPLTPASQAGCETGPHGSMRTIRGEQEKEKMEYLKRTKTGLHFTSTRQAG